MPLGAIIWLAIYIVPDAAFDKVAKAMVASASPRKMFKALYQGPLPIGDTVLDCVILDDPDNTRVISMTSVFRAFGRVPRSNNRVINIPAFIDAQNLQKYINQELMGLIKPIEYLDGKTTQTGYNALILPAICIFLRASYPAFAFSIWFRTSLPSGVIMPSPYLGFGFHRPRR